MSLPILGIGLIVAVNVIYESFERSANKANAFTKLVEREYTEADLPDAVASPKALSSFEPAATGKLVRITLLLNDPYEFKAAEPGENLLKPRAELQLLRGSGNAGSIIRQTTTVEWQYTPSMSPLVPGFGESDTEFRKRRYAIRSKMVLEFTPTDKDTYQIKFQRPERGFARYKLVVEQQGI